MASGHDNQADEAMVEEAVSEVRLESAVAIPQTQHSREIVLLLILASVQFT
jgi:hypothetical protein